MEKRINELEKKEVDLNKQIQCHINIVIIYIYILHILYIIFYILYL